MPSLRGGAGPTRTVAAPVAGWGQGFRARCTSILGPCWRCGFSFAKVVMGGHFISCWFRGLGMKDSCLDTGTTCAIALVGVGGWGGWGTAGLSRAGGGCESGGGARIWWGAPQASPLLPAPRQQILSWQPQPLLARLTDACEQTDVSVAAHLCACGEGLLVFTLPPRPGLQT